MAGGTDTDPDLLEPSTVGPTKGKHFLRLFLQNERRLYAYILTLLPNRTDADDAHSVGMAPNTGPPFSGTKWRVQLLAAPTLDIETEREQTGSILHLQGRGYTPGDNIDITAEGIVGMQDHAAFFLPASARADGRRRA